MTIAVLGIVLARVVTNYVSLQTRIYLRPAGVMVALCGLFIIMLGTRRRS